MEPEINLKDFDEEDDIILPNTLFGEMKLVFFVISRMIKFPKEREKLSIELKRQVYFYARWMKNK